MSASSEGCACPASYSESSDISGPGSSSTQSSAWGGKNEAGEELMAITGSRGGGSSRGMMNETIGDLASQMIDLQMDRDKEDVMVQHTVSLSADSSSQFMQALLTHTSYINGGSELIGSARTVSLARSARSLESTLRQAGLWAGSFLNASTTRAINKLNTLGRYSFGFGVLLSMDQTRRAYNSGDGVAVAAPIVDMTVSATAFFVGGTAGLVGGSLYFVNSVALEYSDTYRDNTVGRLTNLMCSASGNC